MPRGHDEPTRSDETTLDAKPGSLARTSDEPGADANLGRRIGHYRVERLIAHGGMGRVYLAVREDDYEQRVALKLFDRAPEKLDVLDRFFRERQILARLQHPNIARILDGGTTDDVLPFFVMEYVEGEPVDSYCDARGLNLRRRLELFQQICHVAQFAHQNLVVHRDLKPSNILVTPDGVAKLLDFGIAKLLDIGPDGLETHTGDGSPMTPAYASPEQLLGEPVTTASDVYSLGVVLYRLVSGRNPYSVVGVGAARVVELICKVDPPPPSTAPKRKIIGRVANDIDAIVLKAMSKNSEQRYASAAQLAEDIERHLVDLPVRAYPETWRERALRRVRRHRLEIAVFLAVVVFAVTVTLLWRQAVGKEALAQTARAEAEAARTQTENALLRAERVSLFLVELFQAADPYAGNLLTAREILDRGREKLTGELVEEPEIRAELLTTLGTVHNNLSLYKEARELKEEALRNRLVADPSDRLALATDLNNLGRADYGLGDYAAAEDRFRDALAMWRRLGAEDDVVHLGLRNLASTLTQSGQHEKALKLHDEILDVQRRLFGDRSVEVGKSLYSLGVLHRTRGELDAAEPLLRQALEIFAEELGSRHRRVASVLATLGRVLHTQGHHREARESFDEALSLRLELLGEDHGHVANTRKNLAALLLDQGETAAAGALLEKALDVLREKMPTDDWTIADAESLWGSYLVALGRYAEAEPWLLTGYQTIRDARGDADIASRQARGRVLALYDQWGDDEKGAAFASAAPLDKIQSAP
jgi:tetratricopeptide (TPR) repeat protein